jgi:thiamine pyrophosphokinase
MANAAAVSSGRGGIHSTQPHRLLLQTRNSMRVFLRPMSRALIVLAGEAFLDDDVRGFAEGDVHLIAADGGARTLLSLGIQPHVVIGDFDSLDDATRAALTTRDVIHDPDQNTTDFEKALEHAVRGLHASRVAVLGAEGDEPDHMLAALSAALSKAEHADIRFVLRRSMVHIVRGPSHRKFYTFSGARVSLIPLVPTDVRKTEGLEWNIGGTHLSLGHLISISNRAAAPAFSLSLGVGALAVFVERGEEPPW